jgi:LPXTG-motif cell wall-anchored protein
VPRRFRPLAAFSLVVGVGMISTTSADAGAERAPSRDGDSAYVLSDVHCSQRDDGVLDLTLVNDSALSGAQFTVDGSSAAISATVMVAPSSAHALAYTGLADGDVEVPVRIDGEVQLVHEVVDCDPPRLSSRLSAEAVQGSAPVATPELPRTGSDYVGFVIGGLLVSAGIVASWFARRRYS